MRKTLFFSLILTLLLAGCGDIETKADRASEKSAAYESAYEEGYEAGYDQGRSDGRNEIEGEIAGEYTDYENLKNIADFFSDFAVIATPEGNRYHTYDCYHWDGRDFYIFNVEYAVQKGYTPCLDCDPPVIGDGTEEIGEILKVLPDKNTPYGPSPAPKIE